jgi:chemotaxis protein MotB
MKRDRSLEELEVRLSKATSWAVPYTDFMSNMMVLFLMLFAFMLESAQGGKQTVAESLDKLQEQFGGSISKERLDRLVRQKEEHDIAKDLQKDMKDKGLEDAAEVKVDAKYVKLILKAPVLFDSGKADLKPEAAGLLKGVSQSLQKSSSEIIVAGHTDNIPIKSGKYGSNWELSMGRAYSVVQYFQEQGIPPKRLTCTGYGEFKPAGDNATSEGRAANRRIEISLLRENE